MKFQNDYLLGSYLDPEDEDEFDSPEAEIDDLPSDDSIDNGIHIDPKI